MKLCFNWLKIADCGQQEFAVDINFLSDSNRIAMMIVSFNEAHLLRSEPPQAKCDEFNFNILKAKLTFQWLCIYGKRENGKPKKDKEYQISKFHFLKKK